MTNAKQRGFTIIEVMLFLAISGLLAALLMAGWATKVNTERYRDSVVTLQSFLQQQYNLVYNVENERSQELHCEDASVTEGVGAPTPRGQSDCVILGRLVSVRTTLQDETKLTVQSIIGREPSNPVQPQSDDTLLDVLRDPYKVTVINTDMGLSDAELIVPWGATIYEGDDGKASFATDFDIAIVRSPIDGTVYTYVRKTNTDDFNKMFDVATAGSEENAKMCLDPGASFSGQRMSVTIHARASSQDGVVAEAGC